MITTINITPTNPAPIIVMYNNNESSTGGGVVDSFVAVDVIGVSPVVVVDIVELVVSVVTINTKFL